MKTGTKYTLLLVIFFVLVWVLKNFSPKHAPDEMVIDGIHTPRKPCISVMNEMFGPGLDSAKVCDCLIPKFYEVVKNDPIELAKFKEEGIHVLDNERMERTIPIFESCLRENLIDSNYKLYLTGVYLTGFKRKLLERLNSLNISGNYNRDSISNCVIEGLNNNITLGEYLSRDYEKVEKIMLLVRQCIMRSKK